MVSNITSNISTLDSEENGCNSNCKNYSSTDDVQVRTLLMCFVNQEFGVFSYPGKAN